MATILNLDPNDIPVDGEVLTYNAASQKWIPLPPTGGGGGAPVLGPDDNYVTDAQLAALHTHPAVVAQGANITAARAAIGIVVASTDPGGADGTFWIRTP